MRPLAAAANEAQEVAPQAGDASCSLREFVQSSGLRSLILGMSKDPNAKVTVLLVSPDNSRPVLAVKAPTTEGAARSVGVEMRLLVDLAKLPLGQIVDTIPHVVGVVDFNGRQAAVTTALQGTPMTTTYARWRHTASPRRVARDFAAVADWLADLQRWTATHVTPVDMDAGVASRLGSRFADDKQIASDLDRLAELHETLRQQSVPRTAVHGDLWSGNVLVTGGSVTGVVDWECGSVSGEPVRDLVRFALMYALYLDRRTKPGRGVVGHAGLRAGQWGVGVEYALDGTGWFPELFRRFLGDGLARLGASPQSWRNVAIAGIAEVAALTDEQEFARRHLELFRRVSSTAGWSRSSSLG
jgi:aminoglycoside phosphotransferase (APT) family kinase protein